MIIPKKYLQEVRRQHARLNQNMIEKDLVISYLLQEIANHPQLQLIFKGGTCLAKCYLDYHRLSEDLDFVVAQPLPKKSREYFKNTFLPLLQQITDKYYLDFDQEEFLNANATRYCPTKNSDYLYRFYIYTTPKTTNPIKIDIDISEPPIQKPTQQPITNLLPTSKHLIYPLQKETISCCTQEEIIAEKIRALLTRVEGIQERDIYDLYHLQATKNYNKEITKTKILRAQNYNKQQLQQREQELKHYTLYQEVEELALQEINQTTYEEFFLELQKTIQKLTKELPN